ncbi:RNA polymerase sigma factor [Neosynechococcus sphagnicola sy1]|uniref:RNA polymerase sigma factor n=1 Tax=Neosynechococcus sphagnicola sy1 TaxID=1497020 RepID=A0A098TPY3_9CYAN|nr:sigma-70 family RNA polymerase sigma factor [Neosynechococcus sphagnicola]KGF72888.1 RNA polymerase sigma factor [Neosynechococcus sphagnicola sy1]
MMATSPDVFANVQSDRQDAALDLDSSLIQHCLQGDRHSFRQLYRRHQQRVRSILYQLCGAACLDDLVQDVFFKAWKGLPHLQQTAKFSTWLYRIAWNVASDQRKALAKGRLHLQQVAHHTPTHHSDPTLLHLHYQDLVQRGLDHLSFEHRTVLILHDLQEMPQKEVATILRIPIGTVKSRLFHARAAIRQFLQQQGVHL